MEVCFFVVVLVDCRPRKLSSAQEIQCSLAQVERADFSDRRIKEASFPFLLTVTVYGSFAYFFTRWLLRVDSKSDLLSPRHPTLDTVTVRG